MNNMMNKANIEFEDSDGKVYDYVDGYNDLKNRIVRFVGIPDKRVKEDYLRILRYFRFFSKVSDDPSKHDEASIKAIKDNAAGLAGISAERKYSELKKILSQKYSDIFMKMFYDLKIAEHIGLPLNGNIENYARVYKNTYDQNMNPMSHLFALLNNADDILHIHRSLKLPNDDVYLLNALAKYVNLVSGFEHDEDILKFFKQEFARGKSNKDRPLKKKEAVEIAKYCLKAHLVEHIEMSRYPKFLITASSECLRKLSFKDTESNERMSFDHMLSKRRLRLNRLLYDLKEKWIDSNFMESDANLVESLDDLDSYVILPKKKLNKSKKV